MIGSRMHRSAGPTVTLLLVATCCLVGSVLPPVATRASAEGDPVYDEFGMVPESAEGELFLPDEVLDREWPMPEAPSRIVPDRGIEDGAGASDDEFDPASGADSGIWPDRAPGEGPRDPVDRAVRAGRAGRAAGPSRATGRRGPSTGPADDPYATDPYGADDWGDSDDPLGDLNGIDDHYLDPGEW